MSAGHVCLNSSLSSAFSRYLHTPVKWAGISKLQYFLAATWKKIKMIRWMKWWKMKLQLKFCAEGELQWQINWLFPLNTKFLIKSTSTLSSGLSITNSPHLTLMTWSLGKRLQSAKVRRLPSRNNLLETVMVSVEVWSISSGRGEFR